MFNTREMNENQAKTKFKVLESVTEVLIINMLEVLNLGMEVQELRPNVIIKLWKKCDRCTFISKT